MKIKAFTTILLMLFLASMITMAFTAPVAATPDSDIVGLWRFDEGSGSTAYDSSGYDNHGTLKGLNIHPEWVDGKFGKALSFDGNDGYVEVPDVDILDLTTFTVEAWIKVFSYPSSTYPDFYTVVSKGRAYVENYGLHICSNGKVRWQFSSSGTYIFIDSVTDVVDGDWHHIAGSFSGTKLMLYIDGDLEATVLETTETPDISTYSLTIGARIGSYPSYRYNGIIDEVAIWNVALTADEMASCNLGQLKAEISELSDVDGVDLKKPAVQRKKLLCNKINEVIIQIEAGKYEGAMDKLEGDVKPKLDYYDSDTWLAVEHPELVAKIDLIIRYFRL